MGTTRYYKDTCRITTPFWLVTLNEVQAMGYFQKAIDESVLSNRMTAFISINTLLSKGKRNPQRLHLLHHREYWNNADHIGSLDEIAKCKLKDWPPSSEGASRRMTPMQVLRSLRESSLQTFLTSLDSNQYPHLLSLPDERDMTVLRSERAIVQTSKWLRNCASTYANDVKMERAVLVLLSENGKAKALGMYRLSYAYSPSSQSNDWEQLYEACNRSPSEETVHRFDAYLKVVQKWERDSAWKVAIEIERQIEQIERRWEDSEDDSDD